MQIVYINPAVYDYLAASLLEGLVELGHDVVTSQVSPCGRRLDDEPLRAFAETADLVIVGSNAGVRSHLVQDIANPRKVFVDGGDQQDFGVTNNIRFKAVFKRELNRRFHDAATQFVFPLPFAAEKRYLSDEVVGKDLAVSFLANMHTNPGSRTVPTSRLATVPAGGTDADRRVDIRRNTRDRRRPRVVGVEHVRRWRPRPPR